MLGSKFVPGQRPKAKEKSCQQPHLSGVGAPGESCLMHSWAAYGMSFLFFWRNKQACPRWGLWGFYSLLWRRSLPNHLPWKLSSGTGSFFQNNQLFSTDLFSCNVTLTPFSPAPRILTPMPWSPSIYLHPWAPPQDTLPQRSRIRIPQRHWEWGLLHLPTRVIMVVAKPTAIVNHRWERTLSL